jgi:hypothetical protein
MGRASSNAGHLRGFRKLDPSFLMPDPRPPSVAAATEGGRFEFTTLAPLGERVDRIRRFLQPGRDG